MFLHDPALGTLQETAPTGNGELLHGDLDAGLRKGAVL